MDPPRLVSTSDIPFQFLKAAFLVGSIPFKALRTDPRVSYTLYVPPDHYNPDPNLQYGTDFKGTSPAYQLAALPLVVNIHGTRRNAETCRDRLTDFANSSRVAILAPLYPTCIDSFNDLENYKLLRYKSLRADKALLDILDEVKVRWPGIATEKIFLTGFSGGGQFVQRFLYLYPERLRAVSIGAPGRVTMMDENLKWPSGIKDVIDVFDGSVVDREKIRAVKIQLVVGGDDNEVHGGEEFWKWLAEKKEESLKGSGRIETEAGSKKLEAMSEGRVITLKKVQSEWEKDGIFAQLNIVDGVKHDSAGVLPTVIGFLRPIIQETR
jgi:poly(3-hydroxybutyrate) depolymerase